MGQYYQLVNEDKKEIINPVDLGGNYSFFAWLHTPQAGVLAWVLKRSDTLAGNDIRHPHVYTTLGHWAGDRVTLIGDYDTSKLFYKDNRYADISETVHSEFNKAMKLNNFGPALRMPVPKVNMKEVKDSTKKKPEEPPKTSPYKN